MAVLPWGHGRNQTSGGNEKSKSSTLDWLSRTSAEPSRHAITQLMKQHSRGGNGGSVNLRIRSRASTPTPQQPIHRNSPSVDSRPGSAAGKSSEKSMPSQSRPETPIRPSTPGLERSDSSSKSFLSKSGGLLRRKGSKIGMNFNTNTAAGVVSPPRPTSSRAGLRGKDAPASPLRDDGRRPSISGPFDFTHIMHGDINAFSGLGRIDETDLASQFDAIQARYRDITELGSPLPMEPQALTPVATADSSKTATPTLSPLPNPSSIPTALPQMFTVERPVTPPPQILTKDIPATYTTTTSPTDVRASRSTENFSRPTPRSPTTTPAVRPSSCHLQQLPKLATSDEPIHTKPLPQLPTVVHAVSTQDDTARMLMSVPLPVPPNTTNKTNARHHRQSSSRSSLRHMSTFPSARHPQTTTLISDGQLLGIKEEDGCIRPRSDCELTQRVRRSSSVTQTSLTRESLIVEDWEVAIDSAWDMEDDPELHPRFQSERRPSTNSKLRESYLTIDQSVPESGSTPSTPLMTMSPIRRSRTRDSTDVVASQVSSTNQPHMDDQSPLVGLGIETSNNRSSHSSRSSKPPTLEVVTTDLNRSNASLRLTRSAYSAISHSSSQESIILSIASSIMSTQRSSISSVSVSDYAHTGKSERLSVSNPPSSPLLTVTPQKAARPESGCLPSTYNSHKAQKARPDSGCLPSKATSKRNSHAARMDRPESICLTQDMLATFPVPEAASRRALNSTSKTSDVKVSRKDGNVSELPSETSQNRVSSGPRGSGSRRTSCTPSGDGVTTLRQRSNTQGSRTKSARVSYSLFPNAGNPALATNLDVDGVTS